MHFIGVIIHRTGILGTQRAAAALYYCTKPLAHTLAFRRFRNNFFFLLGTKVNTKPQKRRKILVHEANGPFIGHTISLNIPYFSSSIRFGATDRARLFGCFYQLPAIISTNTLHTHLIQPFCTHSVGPHLIALVRSPKKTFYFNCGVHVATEHRQSRTITQSPFHTR